MGVLLALLFGCEWQAVASIMIAENVTMIRSFMGFGLLWG
jgi:hypothetical protein